jgi:hypothetical protein
MLAIPNPVRSMNVLIIRSKDYTVELVRVLTRT